MPKKGLPTEVKAKIWQLKSVENKPYAKIKETLGKDNIIVTDNQIRETVREMRHGNRYGRNESQLAKIHMDTDSIRTEILTDINSIIKATKDDLENVYPLLQALKMKLTLASEVDKFAGRGTPRTQINILQIRARDEKFDKLYDWLLGKLPPELLDEFESFIQETDKTIEAKYEEVIEDVNDEG